MRVNIGLAQIYPKLGHVSENLDKHLQYIDTAISQGVDLIVFPELSLTGYQVQDLVSDVAIQATPTDLVFGRLLDASRAVDVMFGFVERDARNRYYIAAAYLSQGEIIHVHHKVYLPTYAMFDEGRYFDQGESIRAFDTRFGRVGMLICEEFWHISPAYLLWLDGADILLLQSASSSYGLGADEQLGSTRRVELINQAHGLFSTNYVIHCNRVGYEDGKTFWGGSSVVDPNGQFLTKGQYFEEMLITQAIDLNQIARTRIGSPMLRDERPLMVQRELARILSANSEASR